MTDEEKTLQKIFKRLDSLERSLDSLEDLAWWTILAEQRGFKVGQRVKMTKRAIRHGLAHRVKHGVTKGTVKAISDLFSITVLLDGYKTPRNFHHSFFEEVWRR